MRSAMKLVAGLLLCLLAAACTTTRVEVASPGVRVGLTVRAYPDLVLVPGYPVYYAPGLAENYFFYDGLFWTFVDDRWYSSAWYNGPWAYVEVDYVPVFILRVPVYYYRRPPAYFRAWRSSEPPRWGERWGSGWEARHRGWDRADLAMPAPAPRPEYQRRYAGSRYPQPAVQRQLRAQYYRYQPREIAGRPARPVQEYGPRQAPRRDSAQEVWEARQDLRGQRQERGPDRREQRQDQREQSLLRDEREQRWEPREGRWQGQAQWRGPQQEFGPERQQRSWQAPRNEGRREQVQRREQVWRVEQLQGPQQFQRQEQRQNPWQERQDPQQASWQERREQMLERRAPEPQVREESPPREERSVKRKREAVQPSGEPEDDERGRGRMR